MKRRLIVPIVFAGLATAAGVASANPTYWRQNGLLLEVSADPRDGRDMVQVDPTRATQLELTALEDTVTLRGMTLHFSDGRAMTQRMSFVRPGQPVLVDLPHNCGAITSVELDYGDPELRRHDRTDARLQIRPRMTPSYDSQYGSYRPYPPAPATYIPPTRPSRWHVVRARPARAAWSIQASFRF